MHVGDFELSTHENDTQLFVTLNQVFEYDAHTWLSRDEARELSRALLQFAETGSLE